MSFPQKDCVATLFCHCERSRLDGRVRQSLHFLTSIRLLQSLHSFAMTLRHSLSVGVTAIEL